MLVMILLTAINLAIIIYLLGSLVSMKIRLNREKFSPFECGFSPKFNARMPFSMRFFLLTLVFLIFDVELVLIFPYLLAYVSGDPIFSTGGLIIFLGILLMGVLHEWNQGMLDWAL